MVYGLTITDILNQWVDFGVFAYVLPFLLIFAVVYGILNKSQVLGANKGVMATISIAVGLLALYNDQVTLFFENIFPYAGIGLSILLVALILTGLITDGTKNDWVKHVWFGIGAVIFIVVVWASLDNFAWGFGVYGSIGDIVPLVLLLGGLVALIIWMTKTSSTG